MLFASVHEFSRCLPAHKRWYLFVLRLSHRYYWRYPRNGVRMFLPYCVFWASELLVPTFRNLLAVQRLRWSRGSVLAFGTQVRGFKPGRQIFQAEKILSTPSFGREVKPFVPCRIFAASKRTRKCMRGSRSFRSKLSVISRPSSSSFH